MLYYLNYPISLHLFCSLNPSVDSCPWVSGPSVASQCAVRQSEQNKLRRRIKLIKENDQGFFFHLIFLSYTRPRNDDLVMPT